VAPLLSRATRPERVRRTSESASRQLQSTVGFRTRLERNCRAAASQIRLGALPPAPTPLTPEHSSGTLSVACAITSAHFHRRHAGCRSRVIAPHSSRQPACRPPRLTISFLRKYVRRAHACSVRPTNISAAARFPLAPHRGCHQTWSSKSSVKPPARCPEKRDEDRSPAFHSCGVAEKKLRY